MEHIKLPTNKDFNTDDLINIVKSSNEEVTYDDPTLDDVKQFIIQNDIKDGAEVIPASLIYKTYHDWANGKPSKNMNGFFKKFGKYFRRKRIQGYSHYLLDPEPFDLPDEDKRKSKNGEKQKK